MGYSMRVSKWRYTAWVLWDSDAIEPIWTDPPFGEELYAHPLGDLEPANRFDKEEHTNLLVDSPRARDAWWSSGARGEGGGGGAGYYGHVARWLYRVLRAVVLLRDQCQSAHTNAIQISSCSS